MQKQKGQGEVAWPELSPPQIWQNYIKDQTQWLQNYYKKNGVKDFQQKIKQVKRNFGRLKDKIERSNFNQGGRYFIDFAKQQKEKYFRKLIKQQDFNVKSTFDEQKAIKLDKQLKQLSDSQNEQQSAIVIKDIILKDKDLNHEETYSKLFYQNHKNLIQFLTQQRFSFLNVARHIYRGQNQQNSFIFDVQRGYKGWQITSNLLFYIFMRDITKSILQLQQHGIIHMDIVKHNILVFNCSKDKLNSIEYLRKEAGKIRFKLIDFGNAVFFKGKFTTNIVQERKKKECILYGDPLDTFMKQMGSLDKILDEESYKQFHSKTFLKVVSHIDSFTTFKVQKKQQWEQMIKKRQYNKIIQKMQKLIKQQIQKTK